MRPVARGLIAGVEAALEAHEDGNAEGMHAGHDFAGALEVVRDGLFAHDRHTGLDGRAEQVGMGGGDGGDHQRIDGRQERVKIRDSLHIQIGGYCGSKRRVDVVQHNGGNVGVGRQPFGVRSTNAADPGNAHAHISESVPKEATCRGAQVDWVDGTQGIGGMARPGSPARRNPATRSVRRG